MTMLFSTCDRCGVKKRVVIFPQVKDSEEYPVEEYPVASPIVKRIACFKCINEEDQRNLTKTMIEHGWEHCTNDTWARVAFILMGRAPRRLLEVD